MKPFKANRRKLLKGLMAAPLVSAPWSLSFAANAVQSNERFILLILRGAMDGLAAVQPYGDNSLRGLRDPLLVANTELKKLDSFFGLHPAFNSFYEMYQDSELLVCHAVATPYRKRSHFDAQNVLEIGLDGPDPGMSGWLNRCVPFLNNDMGTSAMAIGQTVPHVLLGDSQVGSWAPAVLPMPSDSTMARLKRLYDRDEFLGAKLDQALMANDLIADSDMSGRIARGQNFNVLANAAAKFMREENGPRIAVLENSGWDTHSNQGAVQGQLARKFTELDEALAALKTGLGNTWQDTVVLIVTEFGRTVASNGTRGTDHGTASVAFMLGGNIRGGQILADWPGLDRGNLYENRDLHPTLDMRVLFKSVLRDHMHIREDIIDSRIFPDSGNSYAPFSLI